jgi:thiaminase (transcriptional activator TenA)
VKLVAALLPCMWGYHELATQLWERGRRTARSTLALDRRLQHAKFGELAAWCRTLADEASESSSRPRMLGLPQLEPV